MNGVRYLVCFIHEQEIMYTESIGDVRFDLDLLCQGHCDITWPVAL